MKRSIEIRSGKVLHWFRCFSFSVPVCRKNLTETAWCGSWSWGSFKWNLSCSSQHAARRAIFFDASGNTLPASDVKFKKIVYIGLFSFLEKPGNISDLGASTERVSRIVY
jgi:hypothetical protein